MAWAKKCDRCGKLFEHYDGSVRFKEGEKANAVSLIDRNLEHRFWNRKSYDLCPECMKKLEIFFKRDIEILSESSFEITLEPRQTTGTMTIGGETFDVYLGDVVSHACGGTIIRSFHIIEV